MKNICRNGHPRSESRITPKGCLICRVCERNARNRYYTKHIETRSIVNAMNDRKLRTKKRTELLEFMGNKCVKCGFNDPRALQIDHIDGGGTKESKKYPSLSARYKLIYNHSEQYQLLCANCNAIKIWENSERITKY